MDLQDVGRKVRSARGDTGALVWARGENDVARLVRGIVRLDSEPGITGCAAQAERVARLDGGVDSLRVVLDVSHHRRAIGEAVGIRSIVRPAWQLDGPVGKLEHQRVPALGAPSIGYRCALKNYVLAAEAP